MTLLYLIAIILIALTVLFIGILPLIAVAMKDDETDNNSDWKETTQKIQRTS